MLAILLISCATLTQAPSSPPESIARAPQLPPWPTGLSALREDAGETCMGKDRTEATNGLIRACRRLPDRCQSRLDEMWGLCGDLATRVIRVERADCLGTQVKTVVAAGRKWPSWQVAVVSVALASVAGMVGYMAGRLQND